MCCNNNVESLGCTTNGGQCPTSGSTNPPGNGPCDDTAACAGATCSTTGSGSCELQACVSADGQTCYYTLAGATVCTGSCANLEECENQAGTALSNCEGGGSSCALTPSSTPRPALPIAGVGILIGGVIAAVHRARARQRAARAS